MRSVAAGAFEVGLGGVESDGRTTPLRQRRRYDTRAATHVQHLVASFDPGEIEKWTCQAAAPSRHEVLIGSGVGRQEPGRREGHCRTRLVGPFRVRKGARVKIGAFFSATNKNGNEFSRRLRTNREGASPQGRDASLAARRPRRKPGE